MATGPYELTTQVLGPLPIVNAFCDRLGLSGLLETFLPHDDARLRLAPATAIGVVVRNLVLGREPVYALGEWAAPFDPASARARRRRGRLAQRRPGRPDAGPVVRRRPGQPADPAGARRRHELRHRLLAAAQRLHLDHADRRLRDADGRARGGKATAAITFGHNKDHRPDLKQLVWILTVTADGAVPIAYRVADGNTNDDRTHIDTWNGLVALTGRTGFLYVADCKLASRENMAHIDRHGGRFVSVLPATRKEDKAFRDWIVDHEPDWTQAARRPGRRQADPDQVWHTSAAPWPSAEGHRVVWVRSSAKIDHDAQARTDRIARGIAALDDLNQRLASPKTRMKTTVAVEQAAAAALEKIGATRWIGFTVARNSRWARDRDCRALRRRVERQRHSRNPTQRLPRRPRVATPAGWSRRGPDSNPRAKRVGEHATSGWVTSLGAESAMASVMRWTRSTG